MWTRQATRRIQNIFSWREAKYWKTHPDERLEHGWNGALWNKANQLIEEGMWNAFREWLMDECTETYIKEEMLGLLQLASETVYDWFTSLCEE